MQIYPKGDRPIAYLSKKFTQAQRKWSPTEQECYAFICALDKRHNYLHRVKFTWETDHKALTQLNKKAQVNKRCERWRLKILEYDFMVKYIPGLTNSVPDYLSRSPVEDAEEDPDEVSLLTSQSTQTDFEFNNEYSPIIAPIHTRSTQLHNTTSHDSINTLRITPDTLPLSSSTELPDSLVGEHRTTSFSTEQLTAAQ